jgi:hypothetical protein
LIFGGGGGVIFGSVAVAISFCGFWGVDSLALVFHVSNESAVIVSGICYGLDTTVGKVDTV